MGNNKKSQKLEVMLKSYELVEMAIQNHIQKISTMTTGFVAILGVIIGLIAAYGSTTGPTFQELPQIKFLLLFLPIFIVLIYAYLVSHRRTMIFDSAYAREMEKRINELFGSDKTIYFEILSYPLIKHKTSMDKFINIFLFLSFIITFYFIWKWQTLLFLLKYDFLLCIGYLFFMVFMAAYFGVTLRWTLEEWSEEVEKWVENEEPDISKLRDFPLLKRKAGKLREEWEKFKRKAINKLLSKIGFKP